MPVKSILEIDVQDHSFRSFQDQWRRYQEQLAKAPGQWRAQAVEIKGAKTAFDKLVFDAIALNEQHRIQNKAQLAADRLMTRQTTQWGTLVRHAREFSGHVSSAVTALMRAVPVTAAVGGLLGAGSLFGLERLAGSVAAGRKSSAGIGATYGEQRAFNLNYERLLESPQGFLEAVNRARHDVTMRQGLYGAGLTEGEIAGKSTGQLASALIPALKRFADRYKGTGDAQLQQIIEAQGLGRLGIGLEDVQRLQATSPAEIAQLQGRTAADARAFGLGGDTQKRWRDFYDQLERAGQKIEASLVKGLDPLIPGLDKLSESVAEATTTFLSSFKKEDLVAVGDGIRWVADKVKFLLGYRVETPTGPVGDLLKSYGAPRWTYDPAGAGGLGRLLLGDSYVGDLGIKSGAGAISPGQMALARALRGGAAGVEIGQFTSFRDSFHAGRQSAHNEDRAFDLTVRDPARHAAVAEMIRSELRAMGVEGRVLDEYANPSKNATGRGHLHVETRNKIEVSVTAPSGSQVNWQANAAGAGAK